MDCPKCGSDHYVKDGIANRRQRYKCKKCGYRYTVKRRSSKIPDSIKRFALQPYPEGLGFRSIERLLGVSHVSVMNWVAGFAEKLAPLRSPTKPAAVEIDELHSYVHQKKNRWVWIAVDRLRRRYVGFAVGDGSAKTGRRLWRSMRTGSVELAPTDRWRAYGEFLPPSKHFASKAETFTVEGYNSRIGHYLARFGRKTKCYSKSQKMMFHSPRLPMQKLNGDPYLI